MLVEFSLKVVYSTMYGKNFQIYGVHIPRKCIEFRHFYSCPLPPHSVLVPKFLSSHPRQREISHSQLPITQLIIPRQHFFWKFVFPQQQKGVEETMIFFIRIQSKNMKVAWNIRLFIFCMICNFFKYIFVNNICHIVWYLLPLLCIQNNLILNLHQKKLATLMKGGFL